LPFKRNELKWLGPAWRTRRRSGVEDSRMSGRRVAKEFRIPEAMWERLEPLLPKRRKSRKGGRPPLPLRRVVEGVFYVLRTGCQWKAAPPEFGSGSSLHRYFQRWVAKGVFETLWAIALLEYDDLKGIEWRWQSMDGAMTKAPLGGGKDGPQPDRPRQEGSQTQRAYRWRRDPLGARRQRRQHA